MKPLYSESDIPKYGNANLQDNCPEIHCRLLPDGTYQQERSLKLGETTDIAALAGVVIAVEDVF